MERENWDGLGVDGSIILEWIFKENVWRYLGWFKLAQDKDKWLDLVNTVMYIRVSCNPGNFLTN
jgi:hypothetical protein